MYSAAEYDPDGGHEEIVEFETTYLRKTSYDMNLGSELLNEPRVLHPCSVVYPEQAVRSTPCAVSNNASEMQHVGVRASPKF